MTTLGVGIDLVDVARFEHVLRRRPKLIDRVFTVIEQTDAQRRPERLAARFAAKEATFKALGIGLGAAKLRDVEVRSSNVGAPMLYLHGNARRLAHERGVTIWHVSLTHTATSAAAVVVGSSL